MYLGSIFGQFWDRFLVHFRTKNRLKKGSEISSMLRPIFGPILVGFGLQNRPQPGHHSGGNFVRGAPGSSWRCCFAFLSLLVPFWWSFGPILGPSWADFGPQDGSQIGFWADLGSQMAFRSIKIYMHPYILARRSARSD